MKKKKVLYIPIFVKKDSFRSNENIVFYYLRIYGQVLRLRMRLSYWFCLYSDGI